MNFASSSKKSQPYGQLPLDNVISSSDNDEEDIQAAADKIHNDNFNIKLKVHMLNKLLDEKAGEAESKVKEDIRSMERKMELSQRRYERLVRNRRRQKNRVDKRAGTRLGYDGLSKISRNNNSFIGINSSNGNQKDDGISFSAVEREQKDVEQRFRDRFGSQLLLPASENEQKLESRTSLTHNPAPPLIVPKFSTLFGGLGNEGGQELKSGRIEELLPSPQSPQLSGKDFWNAKKVTRFANTKGLTISPSRSPPGVHKFDRNTNRINFSHTNNISINNNDNNGALPQLGNLSLTDSDDPFSITEVQEPEYYDPLGNTGIKMRNKGIWISDSEYEEFRQLKLLKARQDRKIEEQESEIYRLRAEIRIKESEVHDNKFSSHINNTTNRVDFFSNLRRRQQPQPNSEEVNLKRNKTIKGLTWVYDSFKNIQGIPPDLLSTFQDCILDITYNYGRDNSLQILPSQPSTLAKPQPLESITESQQLAIYQYELNRVKQRASDLAYMNNIKSRQIEVYQLTNKRRIQFMRSLGLILPEESSNLKNNNFNRYSYRNKLLLTSAERQKLEDKFRAAIYYVIAARRFVQRLDDKMIEKGRLRQRLIELGREKDSNTRVIGDEEKINNLLQV
jgi:hypothetical protein